MSPVNWYRTRSQMIYANIRNILSISNPNSFFSFTISWTGSLGPSRKGIFGRRRKVMHQIVQALELSAAFWADSDADSAGDNKKKDRKSFSDIRSSSLKAAATYSPTWWGSTIGASELNFSVRYGKRWILTAIAAAVYVWKQITDNDFFRRSSLSLSREGYRQCKKLSGY